MESQYEKYMRIRSEEIKSGKGLNEATQIAFERAYKPEKSDPQSYKDR